MSFIIDMGIKIKAAIGAPTINLNKVVSVLSLSTPSYVTTFLTRVVTK